MLCATLIVLAALAQGSVALAQAPKPAEQQHAKPLEIGLVCPSWGQEVPRASGNGFDLHNHSIRVTVDGTVVDVKKLPALLETKAKALPNRKPRQAVVGCAMGVTYGDVIRVAEIARDAGFEEIRLSLTSKGARAPAGKPAPKPRVERAPIELVLVRRNQLTAGLVPPIAEAKAKGPTFDARLSLDFDQTHGVKHNGNLVYRWAPRQKADSTELVAAVRGMAAATAGARNAGEPTLIFVRADRCTEVFLIRKTLAICANASRAFDGFGLVAARPPAKKR